MKKLVNIFVFCLAFCMLSKAQTAVIILSDTAEHSLSATTKKTYTLDRPAARLTLMAKHTPSTVTTNQSVMGTLKIEQEVNGSWETLYESNPGIVTTADRTILGQVIGQYEASVAYESLAMDLNRHATQLRFTGSALQTKQIKNVQVTMASYVEVSPKTLAMGEMVVWSDPVSKRFAVEHCNVARLSMTSSNPDFVLEATTVAGSGIGQYATDSFTVTFTPNIMGQHQATIVVTNGTYTDSIHVTAKVTKRTPIFTMAQTTMTVGDTIDVPLTSDCTNALMLGSCDGSVVEISCGRMIALSAGEAVVTAMQLGDDSYWNNKVETYNVTVAPASIPTSANAVQTDGTIRFDGRTLYVEEAKMVEIYDMQGALVESHECEGSLSTRLYLPAGAYTVVARNGQSAKAEKIVVE